MKIWWKWNRKKFCRNEFLQRFHIYSPKYSEAQLLRLGLGSGLCLGFMLDLGRGLGTFCLFTLIIKQARQWTAKLHFRLLKNLLEVYGADWLSAFSSTSIWALIIPKYYETSISRERGRYAISSMFTWIFNAFAARVFNSSESPASTLAAGDALL